MSVKQNIEMMCTCGPSLAKAETIAKIFEEGVESIRINFSHGQREDHVKFYNAIKEAIKITGKNNIKIMGDIQGPKFRVGLFENKSIQLELGQEFTLDSDQTPGNQTRCYLPHIEMIKAAQVGDKMLINDGFAVLEVLKKFDDKLITKVTKASEIGNMKGISLPARVVPCEFPTKKDFVSIETANMLDLDVLMLSFVQTPEDVLNVRKMFKKELMAKIETPAALENVVAIANVSDSILIARGDLGVEAGMNLICKNTKLICEKLKGSKAKLYTATQYLESMVKCELPTRAEANDIYWAIQDGVQGILLTGETANSVDPVASIQWLKKLI